MCWPRKSRRSSRREDRLEDAAHLRTPLAGGLRARLVAQIPRDELGQRLDLRDFLGQHIALGLRRAQRGLVLVAVDAVPTVGAAGGLRAGHTFRRLAAAEGARYGDTRQPGRKVAFRDDRYRDMLRLRRTDS